MERTTLTLGISLLATVNARAMPQMTSQELLQFLEGRPIERPLPLLCMTTPKKQFEVTLCMHFKYEGCRLCF